MTNQLKKAPTKELKFNQAEIAFIFKCLDLVSETFWSDNTQNKITIDDIDTMVNIHTQILNTPYNESN